MKFYSGQNDDCIPGDKTSDSSEKLMWTIFFFFKSFIEFVQRRPWHPTPILLPRKSHGRRSLEG